MTDKKFNRPSWDWSAMEPDNPITFTIIFDRNEKDDGSRTDDEGEIREWHKMVCKIGGEDHTVFSQNEQMYDNWMKLDLNHKGEEFTVTKKAIWNKDTKKFKTTYEIQSGGTVVGKPKTETTEEPPAPKPTPRATSEYNPTPQVEKELNPFKEPARIVWGVVMDFIYEGIDLDGEITEAQERQIIQRTEIVRICPAMINTLVIQNGGRK